MSNATGKARRPAAERIERREKQRKALELRRAGANYDDIARQLGFKNRSTAHRLVEAAMKEITREPAEELRSLEVQRLDALMMGLWPRARRGEAAAVTAVLRIMERRAKLLGLDAVQKHELSGPNGGPITSLTVHADLLAKLARLAGEGEPSGDALVATQVTDVLPAAAEILALPAGEPAE